MRRARFLDVAARLIGDIGFDAVTMTAIAEQSSSSIGTLYDYFPDKQAVAFALLVQYAHEMDEYWKRVLENAATLKTGDLADLLIDGAVTYARERPAFLPLHSAPFVYSRSPAERHPLRKTIAEAVQRVHPEMSDERAFLSAQVVVELIKGLFAVCRQIDVGDRDIVTAEFKKLMRVYLIDTIA